ncbi:MAG: Prephenate dehydratase [Acetothermia bacterium 64_32]|nr:MAG: Prephenate dehydratase [Acetothermia bacterium 64_32]HAF69752.1 prephenate dehydratase [Candidatus Acetothermia bacterium]
MGWTRVAFQGERGAFSEEAAVARFGEGIELLPCRSFQEVFQRVKAGKALFGVVPIENSLAGSVHQVYDLLLAHELFIVGEVEVRISHHLIALPGVKLAGVRQVLSHPQALAQCQGTLARLLPHAEPVPTYDTAGSAKLLAERGTRDAAAIASRRAARIYGLVILREHLEDDPENYTRFLVLSPSPVEPQGAAKTSLVFSMENVPGALHRCLGAFARRGIDLTKIESRPLRGRRWQYAFYVDFLGRSDEPQVREALAELEGQTSFLRVLGSYPPARG